MYNKKYRWFIFLLLLFPFVSRDGYSQTIQTETLQELISDTIPQRSIEIGPEDLDHIPDLQSVLEKENETYSRPRTLNSRLLRKMRRDELRMSDEAMFWARRRIDPSETIPEGATFKDTIIVNPIFLPLIFRDDSPLEDLSLYDEEKINNKGLETPIDLDISFLEQFERRRKLEKSAYRHIARKRPDLFRYSRRDFPKDRLQTRVIEKTIKEDLPIIRQLEPAPDVEEIGSPTKFIPDRLYWTSLFQSEIRFSQNYISPNWHKGGNSSINLYTRNHLQYNYKKEKVNWTNELETKTSLYNSQKDTVHNYQVGEDVFRIHSNMGYEAFSKWYYTFDAEFKTQLFTTYKENSDEKLAAFLAPLTFTWGLGMKYDLEYEFQKPGKNLKFTINLAPLAYTYMYSVKKHGDIDLGRHGFEKKPDSDEYEHVSSLFGSTVRADLTFGFTPNITWSSRFYYFTSYEKAVGEFENSLDLAINRFFSTKIYFYLRFDDSVEKNEDFDSYFQVNQLLSFGFSYKW